MAKLFLLPNEDKHKGSFPHETSLDGDTRYQCNTVNSMLRCGLQLRAGQQFSKDDRWSVSMRLMNAATGAEVRPEGLNCRTSLYQSVKGFTNADPPTMMMKTDRPPDRAEQDGGEARKTCAAECSFHFKFAITAFKDIPGDPDVFLRFSAAKNGVPVPSASFDTLSFRLVAKKDDRANVQKQAGVKLPGVLQALDKARSGLSDACGYALDAEGYGVVLAHVDSALAKLEAMRAAGTADMLANPRGGGAAAKPKSRPRSNAPRRRAAPSPQVVTPQVLVTPQVQVAATPVTAALPQGLLPLSSVYVVQNGGGDDDDNDDDDDDVGTSSGIATPSAHGEHGGFGGLGGLGGGAEGHDGEDAMDDADGAEPPEHFEFHELCASLVEGVGDAASRLVNGGDATAELARALGIETDLGMPPLTAVAEPAAVAEPVVAPAAAAVAVAAPVAAPAAATPDPAAAAAVGGVQGTDDGDDAAAAAPYARRLRRRMNDGRAAPAAALHEESDVLYRGAFDPDDDDDDDDLDDVAPIVTDADDDVTYRGACDGNDADADADSDDGDDAMGVDEPAAPAMATAVAVAEASPPLQRLRSVLRGAWAQDEQRRKAQATATTKLRAIVREVVALHHKHRAAATTTGTGTGGGHDDATAAARNLHDEIRDLHSWMDFHNL